MTLFGIDIAKYQSQIKLAEVKREGFSWVEAKASTGYKLEPIDPAFQGFKTAAAQVGLPFVAYHFLYPGRVVSIADQALTCAKAVNDTRVPIMIDHETADGNGIPSVADAVLFCNAMKGHGYGVPLWYLPHWVWQQLGSPSLANSAGMKLVASDYVSGRGYASSLYPGANHWPSSYGGLTPQIWQFTDKAYVASYTVDADAYEGSLSELMALLNSNKPAPPEPAFDWSFIMSLPGVPEGLTYQQFLAQVADAVCSNEIPHTSPKPNATVSLEYMLKAIDDHVNAIVAKVGA